MSSAVVAADAERALASLARACAEMRSCALVVAGGELLAASVPGEWEQLVGELWAAADAAAGDGPAVAQLHVATESGEVLALRCGGVTAVALTDRFVLASLMFCDLRAALRELGQR